MNVEGRTRGMISLIFNAPIALIPVNQVSPARRVRRVFMRFGMFLSIFLFIVVAADVLLEQLISRESGFFVFGTVCLIAAACTALFAVIATIGLVISSVLDDQPPSNGPGPQEPEKFPFRGKN